MSAPDRSPAPNYQPRPITTKEPRHPQAPRHDDPVRAVATFRRIGVTTPHRRQTDRSELAVVSTVVRDIDPDTRTAHMNSDTTLRSQWEAYGDLWTVTDEVNRQSASDGVLDLECTYTDPNVHAAGVTAIMEYMTGFQQTMPGGHFVTRLFVEHHGRSLAHWDMTLGDGTVVGTGASFATYGSDGKLTSMTGFFDAPTEP